MAIDLVAFRLAVCASVQDYLPGLKTCEPHGGRFNLAELKRFATRAPGFLLAVTALDEPEADAFGVSYLARCSAVLVTKDVLPGNGQPKRQQDEVGLDLTAHLLPWIVAKTWNIEDHCWPAGMAMGRNLYNTDLDKTGVAFWHIAWSQRVRLGGSEESQAEICPVPTELYVGIDPEVGPDHLDDYVRIGGAA